MNYCNRNHRQQGLSLIETVVVLAVFGVLVTTLGQSVQSSQDTLTESQVRAVTDNLARRVLDRLAEELRFADPASFVPSTPTSSTDFEYQVVEGWSAGAAVLSAAHKLSVSGGDVTLDGIVIAGDVDALTFTVSNGVLQMVMTLQTDLTIGGSARTITRTVRSDVVLLNP